MAAGHEDEKTEKTEKSGKSVPLRKRALQILGILALAALTVWLFPFFLRLRDEAVRETVREFILGKGLIGAFLMLLLQLLQVILSVIPGEPVEVLFGFIYGPFRGMLLCLLGLLTGAAAIFLTTRALGRNFMRRIEQSGKYERLAFLKDPARRDILIFLLFFIPGTPKDTLTYFAPFTRIECGKFLLISTLARIPSVITSTWAGDRLYSGNFSGGLAIFALTGAIGIAGIFLYDRILQKHGKRNAPDGDGGAAAIPDTPAQAGRGENGNEHKDE